MSDLTGLSRRDTPGQVPSHGHTCAVTRQDSISDSRKLRQRGLLLEPGPTSELDARKSGGLVGWQSRWSRGRTPPAPGRPPGLVTVTPAAATAGPPGPACHWQWPGWLGGRRARAAHGCPARRRRGGPSRWAESESSRRPRRDSPGGRDSDSSFGDRHRPRRPGPASFTPGPDSDHHDRRRTPEPLALAAALVSGPGPATVTCAVGLRVRVRRRWPPWPGPGIISGRRPPDSETDRPGTVGHDRRRPSHESDSTQCPSQPAKARAAGPDGTVTSHESRSLTGTEAQPRLPPEPGPGRPRHSLAPGPSQ